MTATQEVAVVVQRLVAADRSGVLFTANPTNGMRTQVMINAAWGLGEAIVSGAVTPDMVIVDKRTKRVVYPPDSHQGSHDGADDRRHTGTPRGGEKTKTGRSLRCRGRQAGEIWAVQIEALYGMPMDIEWAASGEEFFILQARPITAIPDPPPPASWKLPKGAYMAMRVNIIELMAEPLSPLFETLGLEVINTSMQDMLAGFLGPGIMPERPSSV